MASLPQLQLIHAPDGLSCALTVVPTGAVEVTKETLVARICGEGVPQDLLDGDAIARVVMRLRDGKAVEDLIVARGQEVVHGTDGRVDLEVLLHDDSIGDATVDHRDKGLTETVDRGARLGTVFTETKGRSGRRTTGEIVDARPGQPPGLALGDNLEVQESGALVAMVDGFVMLREGTLSVLRDFHVRGDVDYTTGHVRLDRGDVHVEGSIRPKFMIDTPGSIYVKGDVEGAHLVAGGDVIVQGVLIDVEGGSIRAGGSVQVSRVTGAVVSAGADVEIRTEAYEATIEAGGVLRVPGRLVGGAAAAAGGAEVGVLGGAGFTETRLEVGRNARRLVEVRKRLTELDQGIDRLRTLVGVSGGREALRQKLKRLEAERTGAEGLRAGLEEERGTAKIEVRKKLFPSVRIAIDGQGWVVEDPSGPCTVARDEDGQPGRVSGNRAA